MRDNHSFYSNSDWLSCLIYCCHSGIGTKLTVHKATDYLANPQERHRDKSFIS